MVDLNLVLMSKKALNYKNFSINSYKLNTEFVNIHLNDVSCGLYKHNIICEKAIC